MIEVEKGGKKHAKFSASGSERWLNCPGSVKLSENFPSVTNAAAEEGTIAHECLEFLIKNDASLAAIRIARKRYNDEMVNCALKTYDYVVEQMPSGTRLLSEVEVRLDFVQRGMFGTTDIVIFKPFDLLWIIDYKYGAGKQVDPEENTQLIYYGLGTAFKYDFNFKTVRLTVAQPRIVTRHGFFRSWDIEPVELMGWISKFKEGVDKCIQPDAPLNPGRWCFFCPANVGCPAHEIDSFNQAQEDFS